MSVQYKSSDGWKNISSSSNNAVDTVENGNMNPVTSNAVYDTLNTVTTGNATILSGASVDPADTFNSITWYKRGGVVTVNGHLKVVETPTFLSKVAEGLPIPINMIWPTTIIFDGSGNGLAFQLNGSGEFRWDSGCTNLGINNAVYFTFTYLAA